MTRLAFAHTGHQTVHDADHVNDAAEASEPSACALPCDKVQLKAPSASVSTVRAVARNSPAPAQHGRRLQLELELELELDEELDDTIRTEYMNEGEGEGSSRAQVRQSALGRSFRFLRYASSSHPAA